MGQALKVIKFDPEDKSEGNSSKGGKRAYLSYYLLPLNTVAVITAILGIISLVLEVKIYFQFRYEIYLARLLPTIISLLTLLLLQTNFGKKNHTYLTHIFLGSVISSLGFVCYKIPSLFLYNLVGTSSLLLLLSLFLYWEKKNQIIVSAYFTVIFGASAIASNVLENASSEFFLLVGFSIITIAISVIALNQREKLKPISKSNNQSRERDDSILNLNDERSNNYWEESIIPIFELKMNGDFYYANNSFCEVLEIGNSSELESKNFFKDFIKNEKVETHLLKKLENKGRVENYRFTYSKDDGSKEILMMDCRTRGTDEEIILEGTLRNITQQFLKDKALLEEVEELRQSKRQNSKIIPSYSQKDSNKSNVISKMGHELRTPMNSVLGFLTLIENGLFENEIELKEFSHSAKLSAESLLGLINDVVEISKIQDGSVEIVKDEFNLDDTLEKVTSELVPHIKQNNQEFSFQKLENVPSKIISDQSKYGQIVTNLLRNAIEVSENGKIKLNIFTKKTSDGKLRLETSVQDSGRGMTENEITRLISNPGNLSNKEYKLTANVLHIMICNELSRLLGGTLTATSEIGKGTNYTFSIDLETSSQIEEENLTKGPDNQANTYSKAKLLLVEDNPISRKVEQKLLREAGYDVDSVDNATAAIKAIEKGIYELVLMDIELKDMNGLQATKTIRALDPPVCNIPIIAVTAHSSMKDREKCLVAGMNDYISKPINITFLKMTIDQWLNNAKSK